MLPISQINPFLIACVERKRKNSSFKKIRFETALNLNKCLNQIKYPISPHTCTPISELRSKMIKRLTLCNRYEIHILGHITSRWQLKKADNHKIEAYSTILSILQLSTLNKPNIAVLETRTLETIYNIYILYIYLDVEIWLLYLVQLSWHDFAWIYVFLASIWAMLVLRAEQRAAM